MLTKTGSEIDLDTAKDDVESIVNDLGTIRLADNMGELAKHPVLSNLLSKSRVLFSSGPRDYMGIQSTYWISPEELYVITARGLVDLVMAKRGAAILSSLSEIEECFFKRAGHSADPRLWQAVILRGWWLKETICTVAGKVVVFIETSIDFELLPKMPKDPRSAG